MTQKHTPTPWKYSHRSSNDYEDYLIHAENGEPLAIVSDEEHFGKSNAAFIVRACNNIERVTAERDALLDVLKKLNGLILHFTDEDLVEQDSYELSKEEAGLYLQARTLIASVEGTK